MRNLLITLGLVIAISFTACESKEEATPKESAGASGNKVTVEEVLQATSYTYLKVSESGNEYWIAITKSDIKEGETIYHADGMEMKNFHSRDLDRDFESVYFVQDVSSQPLKSSSAATGMMSPHGGGTNAKGSPESKEDEAVSVDPVKGGITIAELYQNKSEYVSKPAIIRGEVVKYNAGIMGKNWIHIQDGTKEGKYYDLTVTTNATVKMGEIITVKGNITLDKDFGAGYAYDVIMEDALIVK